MSLKNVQFHSKVIENASSQTGFLPIFAADFKSVEFSLISTDAASDFDVYAVTSIQKNPPDLTIPISADNQWTTDIAYIDESNGATYNGGTPYNPATEAGVVSKVFRFNTNGATWISIFLANFAGGSCAGVNVTLSDNQ